MSESEMRRALHWLDKCRAFLATSREQMAQAERQVAKAEHIVMLLSAEEQRIEMQR